MCNSDTLICTEHIWWIWWETALVTGCVRKHLVWFCLICNQWVNHLRVAMFFPTISSKRLFLFHISRPSRLLSNMLNNSFCHRYPITQWWNVYTYTWVQFWGICTSLQYFPFMLLTIYSSTLVYFRGKYCYCYTYVWKLYCSHFTDYDSYISAYDE